MIGGVLHRLTASAREAVVTITAGLVTAAAALALDSHPATAVFALFLALSLSRSQLERDVRGRLEAGIALPLVAFVSMGVGVLLATIPWAGALLFTIGIAVSVLLRRFGSLGRRLGGLVALPFAVLLVAPMGGSGQPLGQRAVLAVVIGVVAWASVTTLQLLARRVGLLVASVGEPPEPTRPRKLLDATTRLTAQMAAGIGAAFAVGLLWFPDRWAWIVLSALIVSLGNSGRADVAYKGVQRVAGAGVGSALAALTLLAPHLPAEAVAIVVVLTLFVGLVLRPFGYVWWALAVTVALAVSQSSWTGPFDLGQRWVEIALGAGIALAAAWLVLPLRSEDVVRRRIAEVLAALDTWLVSAQDSGGAAARRVRAAVRRLDRAAAPFDAVARVLPERLRPRACGWARDTRIAAAALLADPRRTVRRPLTRARAVLREPEGLRAALEDLVAASAG